MYYVGWTMVYCQCAQRNTKEMEVCSDSVGKCQRHSYCFRTRTGLPVDNTLSEYFISVTLFFHTS